MTWFPIPHMLSQRNATQRIARSTFKFFLLCFLTTTALLFSTASSASDTSPPTPAEAVISKIPQLSRSDEYGCKAYLCFAGGMAIPECQSTITKVKRDLIRGRGFPTCSFLSNPDGSVGGQNDSPRIWSSTSKRRVRVYMQDANGQVKQISSFRR